jgi:anti-sigma regulatory factor (Ser/Thr protein kinase)
MLPASTASIAAARHWMTARARALGASARTVAAMELVTSELVANAVGHAAGTRTVTVGLRVEGRLLRVEVRDGDATGPRQRSERAGRPGGHGMHIVDRVAHSWGWRPDPPGGKVVWASFRLAAADAAVERALPEAGALGREQGPGAR